MWSERYANPLQIDIKPSKIALVVVVTTHLGAITALLCASLPIIVMVLFAMLTLASAVYSLCRTGWISSQYMICRRWMPAIISVCWGDEFWYLRQDNDTELIAQLLPSSFVSRWLVVVNLSVTQLPWYYRKISLLFLPDNIDKEIFRRLRVRLRWYPEPIQDSSVELK